MSEGPITIELNPRERRFYDRLRERVVPVRPGATTGARDLLLLSATPHQGDHFRFWMLIQLLNPTLFADAEEMVLRQPLMVEQFRLRLMLSAPVAGVPVAEVRQCAAGSATVTAVRFRFVAEAYRLPFCDAKRRCVALRRSASERGPRSGL